MASLAALATKCRFAVLEVSSDNEDVEKSGVGDNAGNADANNSTKGKKKRRKKKNKARNEQVMTNSMEDRLSFGSRRHVTLRTYR